MSITIPTKASHVAIWNGEKRNNGEQGYWASKITVQGKSVQLSVLCLHHRAVPHEVYLNGVESVAFIEQGSPNDM